MAGVFPLSRRQRCVVISPIEVVITRVLLAVEHVTRQGPQNDVPTYSSGKSQGNKGLQGSDVYGVCSEVGGLGKKGRPTYL